MEYCRYNGLSLINNKKKIANFGKIIINLKKQNISDLRKSGRTKKKKISRKNYRAFFF